jgi:AcrR family transcriptional regulator
MYTRRQCKRQSTRDRLLEGALQCLREKGYAETTARDIAAAAEANLRSIGYHFGSTKGLLLAAISLNFRHWLEPLIDAAGDGGGPVTERLRTGMARFAEALPANEPMLVAWVEAVAMAGHDPELRAVLARNQTEFREALARTLSAAGEPDPDRRAAAIVNVCDGLIVRFLLHGEALNPSEVARDSAAALERLVEGTDQ